MTHTLDIPPPPFVGHREPPADGPSYFVLSENNNNGAAAPGPGSQPPLRPPPYRRTLPAYLSRRRSFKSCNRSRGCLCCCCCFFLLFIFVFATVLLYIRFTLNPQVPSYKVEHFDVKAFDMRPGSSSLSMEFAITVRTQNPNKKIGIRYRKGGSAAIGYKGMRLGAGQLPAFYQKPRDTTKMVVAVKGRSRLGAERQEALLAHQRTGDVPLHVYVKAPLGFAFGKLELVKATLDINCTMVVDNLSPEKKASIKSNDYNVDVKFYHVHSNI